MVLFCIIKLFFCEDNNFLAQMEEIIYYRSLKLEPRNMKPSNILFLSLALYSLLFSVCLHAQILPKGQYIEGGFNIGRIYKHTNNIVLPIKDFPPTLGVELTWEMQTYGKQYWHKLSGFPRVGLIGSFQHFRDERLGWGYGFMPFISLRFFKIGSVEMFGRFAMGLGYVSKHWDEYSNPLNNLVGSHINNNTGIRLGFGIEAHRNWEIRPSFSFTHYSNGAAQYPNLGTNVMSFNLGILYKHNPVLPEDYNHSNDNMPERHKGPRFSIFAGLGMKEIGRTYRGPKYAITVTSADVGLFTGRNNILKLGLTHEYHSAEYAFFMNNGGYNQNFAQQKANKFLFYVEDEILMGHFSLVGQIGYYFNNAPEPLPFVRLGYRYYPLNPTKHRFAPFVGLRLKAHGITADYIDLTVGVAIR